ncbi:MAG: ATP-binding cassette domain-containing protein [Ornithinimicrobium sp.]|uniref:ATP-binding cassette domain-containing protein n=1 Tax=Ornithinimicrobium sp. TaxID=1977084 RepID=UPI003D9B8375
MDVPSGGVHGFLGPNGSDKTTPIRMLFGLIHADAGRMHIFGAPVSQRLPDVVSRVGGDRRVPQVHPGLLRSQEPAPARPADRHPATPCAPSPTRDGRSWSAVISWPRSSRSPTPSRSSAAAGWKVTPGKDPATSLLVLGADDPADITPAPGGAGSLRPPSAAGPPRPGGCLPGADGDDTLGPRSES